MTAGVSGIVLAGGGSTRFGSDKLAARYGDRSLLELAVAAVATQSAEVIVVVGPDDARVLPRASVPVRRAVDPVPLGGPLVGLLAGLESAREPIVLVGGGDMPTMSTDVLAALVRALASTEGSAEAAVLVQRGVVRPLPAALRNGAATQAARALIADGERSLVALVGRLATRRVEETEWRSLDPEAATLRDVDRPEDIPSGK
jgi:molybdenum cofactor guanylyltransferase